MRAKMPLSGRAYSAILLLYPRTLRREFGQEMVEVFCEQLRDARRLDGWLGEMKLWSCVAGETVRTLATAHMQIVGVSVASALIAFGLMSTFLWSMSR
ncbi:MAG: hypothetical protein WBW69_01805 [Candidatus Korobacteraceae bacterium]